LYGYRDHVIRPAYPVPVHYCPYSTYPLQCPFSNGLRQRIEEFPIQQQQPPKNPPPTYTPKLSDVAEPNLIIVEFGIISPCIFRYTYLWLKNGQSFWSYLVFISRTSASGWQYKGGQWVYFGVDLLNIKNFICS
jgi:hypothetical protein